MVFLNQICSFGKSWRGSKDANEIKSTVNSNPKYFEVIQDPEVIAFFEATTPSVFRKNLSENMNTYGFSDTEIEELVKGQNFRERPVSAAKRVATVRLVAEQNCSQYRTNSVEGDVQFDHCFQNQYVSNLVDNLRCDFAY